MNIKKFSILTFLSLAVFLGSDLTAGRGSGNGAGRVYDPSTVESISGTVSDIRYVENGCCNYKNGVHATLKIGEKYMAVHLGPRWYLDEKIEIKKNDRLEVTGSKIKFGNDYAMIAKTIKKGTKEIKLREDDGTPLWAGRGYGKRN